MDLLSTSFTPDRSCKHCTVAILEATQMTTREKWACVEQRPDNANPVMAAFCVSMVATGPSMRMCERADKLSDVVQAETLEELSVEESDAGVALYLAVGQRGTSTPRMLETHAPGCTWRFKVRWKLCVESCRGLYVMNADLCMPLVSFSMNPIV